MTPSPEDHQKWTPLQSKDPLVETDQDVVITGIGGRFPESKDIDEFWYKLVNGIELSSCNDSRWPVGFRGLPPRNGKMLDMDKFDASFFGVTDYDATFMDAQIRALHEVVYECIIDSGYVPTTFRGTKMASFLGVCYNDCVMAFRENCSDPELFVQMAVNHVVYAFDFRGPAFVIDTACASSFSGTVQAVAGIRKGEFDSAIVSGSALHVKPSYAIGFLKLGMISSDGRSKCMDASANGYCRSESCIAVLLQKRKDARRIYATIVESETNCDGYKPEGITYPSTDLQRALLIRTYKKANLDPNTINYVEAHMTGTAAGDPIESKALLDALRPNNNRKPILVGCLKSNMGHTEGASGVASLTKAALIFQHHIIPPNINFNNPNPNIEGIMNGRLINVLEKRRFNEEWIACNSFGFGGVNVHTILRANRKCLNEESFKIVEDIPRLVNICGRTRGNLEHIMKHIQDKKDIVLTKDYLALLHEVSKTPVDIGINFRGSFIINDQKNIIEQQMKETKEQRPLWFIFSPLGSQWPQMATQLTNLKPFQTSLEESAKYLKSKFNIDLFVLLKDETEVSLSNIINALCAIVAVQVALVDLLTFLDIKPDGIIGHSVGEVAAGYSDGCVTREEALQAAYWMAKKAFEAQKGEEGLMAAVGLDADKAQDMCPEGVDVACINTSEAVTVAGPKEKVQAMVKNLNDKGIFAQEVNCSGVAFHSRMVDDAFKPLVEVFEKVFTARRKRSDKWISTSIAREHWEKDFGRYMTPYYFANEVMATVNYLDALSFVPRNSVILEIGPRAVLLGLTKRVLGKQASLVSLVDKNDDSCTRILKGVGAIYCSGFNPGVDKLYSKIEWPVSRETASLSNLVRWNHSKSWLLTKYPDYFGLSEKKQRFQIELDDPNWKFICDHVIDGRNLFPATGYLFAAWGSFSAYFGKKRFDEIDVEFRNVKFNRATIIPKLGAAVITVMGKWDTGDFCITEGDTICCTGNIVRIVDINKQEVEETPFDEETTLTSPEIYRELRVRGYDYGPNFQGLCRATPDGTRGAVRWLGQWVSFSDSVMQLAIFAIPKRNLFIPTGIEFMRCEGKRIKAEMEKLDKDTLIPVQFDPYTNIVQTKGLYVKGLKASPIARRTASQKATVESLVFKPYNCTLPLSNADATKIDKYESLCNQVLDHIECPSKKLDCLDTVKDMTKSETPQHALLTVLKNVICVEDEDQKSKGPLELLTTELETKKLELSADLLIAQTIQKVLRFHVDLVAENAPVKQLNIFELNYTGKSLSTAVFEILNLQNLTPNYSIRGPKEAEYDCITGKKYLFDDTDKLKFPTDVNELDFLIYSDYSKDLLVTNDPSEAGDSKLTDWKTLFENSKTVLKDGGFLLLLFRSQMTQIETRVRKLLKFEHSFRFPNATEIQSLVKEYGFVTISEQVDTICGHVLLVRKTSNLHGMKMSIVEVKHENYSWIKNLKVSMADEENKRIWVVATDSPINGIIGMVNCLRRELRGDRVRCIFNLGPRKCPKDLVTSELVNKDLVMNVIKYSTLGCYRFEQLDSPDSMVETNYAYVDVKYKGDLSSFTWFESPSKIFPTIAEKDLKNGEFYVDVHYSALNFKDVMVATGRIPLDAYPATFQRHCLIGMEWSGVTKTGQRVMGFSECEGITTRFIADDKTFITAVPDHISLEEAATIPVAYITVYYALFIRGKLKSGESVLIHAGTGGVGQAAISVCLHHGCKVFTTVGIKEKREYIKKMFPALKDENIGDSRSTLFEELILKETNGAGVDLILNSLAEEKLHAGLRCLSKFGRFIEIGKFDIIQDNAFNPILFDENQSFETVCIAHLHFQAFMLKEKRAQDLMKTLEKMVLRGFETGAVRPLPRCVFDKDEAEAAFRFMATGKHTGKVLLRIREETEEVRRKVKRPEKALSVMAIAQTWFHPFRTQIIVGGLGGFGLELAYWMRKRGATKIVLTTRNGVLYAYQKMVIKNLRESGCEVLILKNDATTYESAIEVVKQANKLGPVESIFNLAMVLQDAVIENQSQELFEVVCKPKVDVSMLLDQISRKHCPQLEYFVCFSSAAASRGNASQTNYGYANSCVDRICEKRREEGLHGLSIQWGVIGDVGVVAERMRGNEIVLAGFIPQRISSCLDVLNRLMQSSVAVYSSAVNADKEKSMSGSRMDIVKTVCHVLGVTDPDPEATLGDLGMDSLMCVEIKQGLEQEYDTVLTTQELRQLKIKELAEIGKKKGRKGEFAACQTTKDDMRAKFTLICPSNVFEPLNDCTSGEPVFFLPSIEGNFEILKPIAQDIMRPIIGLNWVEELDKCESIQDVAEFYVKKLRETYSYTGYDLVGYSFGGLIALDMAVQLQAKQGNNSIKNLILLDSAPTYLRHLSAELAHKKSVSMDDDQAHIETLVSFASLFVPTAKLIGLRESFITVQKEERLLKLSTILTTHDLPVDPSTLAQAADRYYKKMLISYQFTLSAKFEGNLFLVRASDHFSKYIQVETESDYGLSKDITGKCEVVCMSGDHQTFLTDHYKEIAAHLEQLFLVVSIA